MNMSAQENNVYYPSPETEVIEVTAGECVMSDDQTALVACNIRSGSIIASYGAETGIGFMGHYMAAEAMRTDIDAQLRHARNISGQLTVWALDVSSEEGTSQLPIITLDCTSGIFTVDGTPLDPINR